ncbi:MAG: hypothetical protein DYH20_09555 [Gammaproteobacteria bacterium PRO9]|nr:hypothetical protein [Gammaproteobacteria bacterium PRO9]
MPRGAGLATYWTRKVQGPVTQRRILLTAHVQLPAGDVALVDAETAETLVLSGHAVFLDRE